MRFSKPSMLSTCISMITFDESALFGAKVFFEGEVGSGIDEVHDVGLPGLILL
jgi:hypothetical protein